MTTACGDDRTAINYDAVNRGLSQSEAPNGLLIHFAGFDEDAGVFRIVNVWETREQGQAYHDEHVMPVVRDVMGEGPRSTAGPGSRLRAPSLRRTSPGSSATPDSSEVVPRERSIRAGRPSRETPKPATLGSEERLGYGLRQAHFLTTRATSSRRSDANSE
jgi:hypothetical protein